MSDIATLKDIVNDYLQTASPSILSNTLEIDGSAASKQTLIDKLILQGANNARKWAEKKHDFSWLDVTLAGVIPSTGFGLGFDLEMWIYPRATATLTVILGVATVQLSELKEIPGVGENFHYVSTDGTTLAYGYLEVTSVDEHYIVLDNTGPVIADGTYTIYWARNDKPGDEGNLKWYEKVKTIHNGWVTDSDYLSAYPIRVETKKRLTSRLIENLDVQTENTISFEGNRLFVHGKRIYCYPPNAETQYVLVDANVWAKNYTADTDTDEFLEHGFEFMQWATIVEVNRLLQRFVARQEGNIAPPNNDRDRALKELIEFDIYQNESTINQQLT